MVTTKKLLPLFLLAASPALGAAPEDRYEVNFGCFRLASVTVLSRALERSSAETGETLHALMSGNRCGLTGEDPVVTVREVVAWTRDYDGEKVMIARVRARDGIEFFSIIWPDRKVD